MGQKKKSAAERIEGFLDDFSFVEIGNLMQARNTDYNLGAKKMPGDGVITGYGLVDGRMVYVYSQDVSVLGGSVGEIHAEKIAAVYDMAMKMGVPVIGMLDCAGLRLQEANDALHAFGQIFKKQAMASGKVPQLCGVFGNCGGGAALMAAMSDFVFMEESGSLYLNSPNVLEGNTESKQNTAGYAFQSRQAGNVDFVFSSEDELLEAMRTFVGLLPSDYETRDSYEECKDDLNRVIPELGDAEYDARAILTSVSDGGFYCETKAMYARDMVTAFIRLNGETIGAVANQPADGRCCLTADGLEKALPFLKFCDAFSIPILTITNVDGFKASEAEEKRAAQLLAQFTGQMAETTTARVGLIAGHAYGTASVVMNSKALGADFVLAWPQASIGLMDAEQAVRIMYADAINGSKDQLSVIAEETQKYEEMQSSALAAARRGYVDDIIEPDATRKRLIAAYEMLYGKKEPTRDKKHASI